MLKVKFLIFVLAGLFMVWGGNSSYGQQQIIPVGDGCEFVPVSEPTMTGASGCSGATLQLSVYYPEPCFQYLWYTSSSGGSSFRTGTTYSNTYTTTTTYYVSATNAITGEVSPRTPVTATVTAAPSNPTVTNGSRCGSGVVALTAFSAGSPIQYKWYTASTGNAVANTSTSTTYSPNLTQTTTYYVAARNTSTGCESGRVPVTATISASLTATLTPVNTTICAGNQVNLAASSSLGGSSFLWSTGATTPTIVVTPATTTTYTVTATKGSCSDTKSVTITVKPAFVQPIVNSATPTVIPATGKFQQNFVVSNYNSAYTYTWKKHSPDRFADAIGTIVTPTHNGSGVYQFGGTSPFSGGNYSLYVTDGSVGCGSSTTYYTVDLPSYNTVETRTFDEFGNTIASGKSFSDRMGRGRQTQAKDIERNQVLIAETVYDAYGRPVLGTMSVPTTNNEFYYDPSFLGDYSYEDFDRFADATQPSGVNDAKVNNPNPVPPTAKLGQYFSTAGTADPLLPTTAFPYSRTEYYNDPTGRVRRASGPGETFKMGSGREAATINIPILDELNHYSLLRTRFVPGSKLVSLDHQGTKSIVVDAHKREAVSFTDKGGQTIATALAGWENDATVFSQQCKTVVPKDQYLEFHITRGSNNSSTAVSLKLPGNANPAISQIVLENLLTGQPVTIYVGTGTVVLPQGFYKVANKSGLDLTVSYSVWYHNFTYNFYDDAGRLKATIAPIESYKGIWDAYEEGPDLPPIVDLNFTDVFPSNEGTSMANHNYMATTYQYNALGWLLSETSPDGGTTEYVYRADGTLKYSQNARQAQEKGQDLCQILPALRSAIEAFAAGKTSVQLADDVALKAHLKSAMPDFIPEYLLSVAHKYSIIEDWLVSTDNGRPFIEFPAKDAYNVGAGDFAIELWVNPTSVTSTQGLFCYGPSREVNTQGPGITLSIYNSKIQVQLGEKKTDGSFALQTATTTASNLTNLAGTWIHVVFVRVGNTPSNWKLYLNGTVYSMSSASGTPLVTGNVTTGGNFDKIKIASDWQPYYRLRGSIANVRFYARAVPAAEATASYAAGRYSTPANTSQLLLYAPLHDQEAQWCVSDASQQANKGSINGDMQWNRRVTTTAEQKPCTPTELTQGTFSYIEYDRTGRTTEIGEFTPATARNLGCTEMKDLLEKFVAQGGDVANKPSITAYVNGQTGLSFSDDEYQTLISTCDLVKPYLFFAGTGYVEFPLRPEYTFTTEDFAIEAWVGSTGTTASTQGVISTLKRGTGSFISGYSLLRWPNANSFNFYCSEGSAKIANRRTYTLFNYSPRVLHHIVLQRIGNNPNDWLIYYDGKPYTYQIFIENNTLTTGNFNGGSGMDNLFLGTMYKDTPNFTGPISQVRMYKRQVTAAEVQANFQAGWAGGPTNTANLVFHAPLNEGQGTPVNLVAGQAGTFKGAAAGMEWRFGINPKPVPTNPSFVLQGVVSNASALQFISHSEWEDEQLQGGAPLPAAHTHQALERQQQNVLPQVGRKEQTYYLYDTPAPDKSAYPELAAYNQRFLAGRLSKSWNGHHASYYSYDSEGRIEWMAQVFTMANGGNKKIAIIKYAYDLTSKLLSVHFQPDVATERFSHYYVYDRDGRLKEVYTSIDMPHTWNYVSAPPVSSTGVLFQGGPNGGYQMALSADLIIHARYEYYLHGARKRIELGDNTQGIDYVYTIHGWLKSINHPDLDPLKDPGQDGRAGTTNQGFAQDAFGMTLDYYAGDYQNARTGAAAGQAQYVENYNTVPSGLGVQDHYDGNVKAWRWRTQLSNVASLPAGYDAPGGEHLKQQMYTYAYDYKSQLKDAFFGTFQSGTFVRDATQRFDEGGITYDPNGNILTLNRNAYKAPVMDNPAIDRLTYSYYDKTNKLKRIDDATSHLMQGKGTNKYGDLVDQTQTDNYIYDAIGRMVQDKSENYKIIYDAYDKVSEVRTLDANLLIVKFVYDDGGNRVQKVSYTQQGAISNVTYYFNDAEGNTMGVYEQPAGTGALTLKEHTLYASGRLGTYFRVTNAYTYELKDHLGNVRATVPRNNNPNGYPGVVLSLGYFADYYPFGWAMPDRDAGSHRYGYQGQETDPETGWAAFQLRMYDGRIGRWASFDPKKQYASPYLAMGNNPVKQIDPDGGFAGDPGRPGFFERLKIWFKNIATSVFGKDEDSDIEIGSVTVDIPPVGKYYHPVTGDLELIGDISKSLPDGNVYTTVGVTGKFSGFTATAGYSLSESFTSRESSSSLYYSIGGKYGQDLAKPKSFNISQFRDYKKDGEVNGGFTNISAFSESGLSWGGHDMKITTKASTSMGSLYINTYYRISSEGMYISGIGAGYSKDGLPAKILSFSNTYSYSFAKGPLYGD